MSNISNTIYPLAYQLASGQTQTLYYLGFPASWKTALLEIAQRNNSRFKDEYGLPTNALKKLVDSWMEGIISLAPLKKHSHDEHWLTSCYRYTEQDIKILCGIIKVWVMATYAVPSKASPLVKELSRNFCEKVCPEAFMSHQSEQTICLTLEDRTVKEEAYQAIPLLAVNRLIGKDIILNGQSLHLCYSGKNQLISQPLTAAKSQHQYSFVFDFSVQTTPPKRQALLLCQMSTRRWIADSKNREMRPFVPENIHAHIKVSDRKYCQIPIAYSAKNKHLDWRDQDRECYNIWGYQQLPPAEDILRNPAEHAAQILLPYKNSMHGFAKSKIGTGVSVADKAALYQAIKDCLDDMICEQPQAHRVSLRGQTFFTLASPQQYDTSEKFRHWVSKCAETDHITFEFYGLWKDPLQERILEQVEEKISQDFGENTPGSSLEIQCIRKEVWDFADEMPNSYKDTQIRRCDEIVQKLGPSETVTACIFVLPGKEHYTVGDPKQVIRNAFARTGRVVQFINPDPGEDDNLNKIENAVYDLYRQLGIVALLNFQKPLPRYAATPCIGMYVCTQVHGISNKARFLPIYIAVDIPSGKTRIRCDAFSKTEVSYREACLEMAQLFWKNDLEQLCVDASRSPAKKKLIEMRNRYSQRGDGVLFLVQSDGNTRALWSGISDKEIGNYEMSDTYCPVRINVGMPKNPFPMPLENTGIRIIRIRSNQEVPDYYTELRECVRYSATSGIFKYNDIFWGIHAKPGDPRYTKSYKESRIIHPTLNFAEKDMVELYPLQLQPEDDAAQWIFYTNALRHISIQYKQSTVLPLPLHLAERLKEYLFDI